MNDDRVTANDILIHFQHNLPFIKGSLSNS